MPPPEQQPPLSLPPPAVPPAAPSPPEVIPYDPPRAQPPSFPFHCNDGSLIHPRLLCNGWPDCASGEDETNCASSGDSSSSGGSGLNAPQDNLVVELDERTLQAAIMTNPRLMLQIVNPDCKRCQKFAPEYAKAALEARRMGLGIIFAKVPIEVHEAGMNDPLL